MDTSEIIFFTGRFIYKKKCTSNIIKQEVHVTKFERSSMAFGEEVLGEEKERRRQIVMHLCRV